MEQDTRRRVVVANEPPGHVQGVSPISMRVDGRSVLAPGLGSREADRRSVCVARRGCVTRSWCADRAGTATSADGLSSSARRLSSARTSDLPQDSSSSARCSRSSSENLRSRTRRAERIAQSSGSWSYEDAGIDASSSPTIDGLSGPWADLVLQPRTSDGRVPTCLASKPQRICCLYQRSGSFRWMTIRLPSSEM
jgi:hypothetical protein